MGLIRLYDVVLWLLQPAMWCSEKYAFRFSKNTLAFVLFENRYRSAGCAETWV